MNPRVPFLLVLSLLFAAVPHARADGPRPLKPSEIRRLYRENPPPVGILFTVAGEPGVNLIGVNYVFEQSPMWRFRVGLGTVPSLTIGAGVDYLMLSSTRFRPFAGIDVNKTSKNFVPYVAASLGVEYRTPGGFIAGLALHGGCIPEGEIESRSGCVFVPFPGLRIGTML